MNIREQSTSHTSCCPQADDNGAPRMEQCQGHCSSLLPLHTAPETLIQLLTWGASRAPLWSFTWRHKSSSWGWSSMSSFPKNARQGEGMLVFPPCTGDDTWEVPPALPSCVLSHMALHTPCQHTKDLTSCRGGWLGCSSPRQRRHFLGVAH